MGNSLGGRKKRAKVMKVDGTTFKVKPPAQAMNVLRDHPGHALLDAEKVQRVGLRARPMDPDVPLKPGKLYFLVDHRQLPDQRGARRAWSGSLQVGAKERLESLRLSHRSMSDLSRATWRPSALEAEETKDGTVRLKMRLPKAQVEKLMQESKDAAEAAEKIMQLCSPNDGPNPPPLPQPIAPTSKAGRKDIVRPSLFLLLLLFLSQSQPQGHVIWVRSSGEGGRPRECPDLLGMGSESFAGLRGCAL
ncbi:hypothetical protein B296_00018743 [Ensete ventricosum]|uniref:Uncharacterized protein n=1 Tax=Ensete ventricosum TaxID=4639 RepID=A0A427ADE4_ENSVE|nr:hypothetical protein B296_00018743 [Ensete ventricosum]